MDLDKSFYESRSVRTSKVIDCCTDRFTIPGGLAYVWVITVHGHTTGFIFLQYYERLWLEGLIFNGFEIYPTEITPQSPFRVLLRGVCTKANKQTPTRTKSTKQLIVGDFFLKD